MNNNNYNENKTGNGCEQGDCVEFGSFCFDGSLLFFQSGGNIMAAYLFVVVSTLFTFILFFFLPPPRPKRDLKKEEEKNVKWSANFSFSAENALCKKGENRCMHSRALVQRTTF